MNQSKRFIIVLGGKGGTGKTAFASVLFYFLHTLGVKLEAYDADDENPMFSAIHPEKVAELELFDPGVARSFFARLNDLKENRPPVVLIDMPGASGYATREQMERFKFLKLAELLGYRLTVCAVLNLDIYAINSLDAMMEFCGDQADYVIVKNQVWTKDGGNFGLWEASSTRKALAESGLNHVEIELPILEPVVFQQMRDVEKNFLDYEQLGIPDFLVVESFLDLTKLQLNLAANYLGLPPVVETNGNKAQPKAKQKGRSSKSAGEVSSELQAQ